MSAPASSLSAREVHARLLQAIAEVEQAEKNLVAWFRVMLERNLFRPLGYSSIYQYAAEELSFSTAKTAQLIRTCRSLQDLPRLREAVESGEIPWTKARTLTPVATPETETAWLSEAKRLGRRELETNVRRAKRTARQRDEPTLPLMESGSEPDASPPAPALPEVPVTVSLRMTPAQYSRYEQLVRCFPGADRAEIVLQALAAAAGEAPKRKASAGRRSAGATGRRSKAGEPPYRIVLYRCQSCGRGHAPTTRGDLPVAPAVLRQAACDSRQVNNGRNMAAIPPSLRRRILDRDGHRCRSAGCDHTQYLEVHHRTPRHRGGTNDPENLITLCSACHRVTHEHGRESGERGDGAHRGARGARSATGQARPAGGESANQIQPSSVARSGSGGG